MTTKMETLFYWIGLIFFTISALWVAIWFTGFALEVFFKHVYKDRTILREVISYAYNKRRYKDYLKDRDSKLSDDSMESLIDVICQCIENDLGVKKQYELSEIYDFLTDETKGFISDEINEAIKLRKEGYSYR